MTPYTEVRLFDLETGVSDTLWYEYHDSEPTLVEAALDRSLDCEIIDTVDRSVWLLSKARRAGVEARFDSLV